MRVLICGGRDFSDYLTFAREVRRIELENEPITTVIHGGARGADWCAHLFATSARNLEELAFPAKWKIHGKAAGPIRNQEMLDVGKPDLVIAFPGGPGTADMVKRSRKAGFAVIEVDLTAHPNDEPKRSNAIPEVNASEPEGT